jgi:D-erythro-7,8-dihydroneopterin triphosphate epimerase
MRYHAAMLLSCGFNGLRVQAGIGVYESELGRCQDLLVDLCMHYPAEAALAVTASDDLTGALDYAAAAETVRRRILSDHHGLLEFLAGMILADLRRDFPGLAGIDLRISKPGALPDSAGSFCELSWRA